MRKMNKKGQESETGLSPLVKLLITIIFLMIALGVIYKVIEYATSR